MIVSIIPAVAFVALSSLFGLFFWAIFEGLYIGAILWCTKNSELFNKIQGRFSAEEGQIHAHSAPALAYYYDISIV